MGRKIPLHEFLLQLKDDVFVISTTAFHETLVSGYLVHKPKAYYELPTILMGVIETMEVTEDKRAYVDIEKLQKWLEGKEIPIEKLFEHLDNLLTNYFLHTDNQDT